MATSYRIDQMSMSVIKVKACAVVEELLARTAFFGEAFLEGGWGIRSTSDSLEVAAPDGSKLCSARRSPDGTTTVEWGGSVGSGGGGPVVGTVTVSEAGVGASGWVEMGAGDVIPMHACPQGDSRGADSVDVRGVSDAGAVLALVHRPRGSPWGAPGTNTLAVINVAASSWDGWSRPPVLRSACSPQPAGSEMGLRVVSGGFRLQDVTATSQVNVA